MLVYVGVMDNVVNSPFDVFDAPLHPALFVAYMLIVYNDSGYKFRIGYGGVYCADIASPGVADKGVVVESFDG